MDLDNVEGCGFNSSLHSTAILFVGASGLSQTLCRGRFGCGRFQQLLVLHLAITHGHPSGVTLHRSAAQAARTMQGLGKKRSHATLERNCANMNPCQRFG